MSTVKSGHCSIDTHCSAGSLSGSCARISDSVRKPPIRQLPHTASSRSCGCCCQSSKSSAQRYLDSQSAASTSSCRQQHSGQSSNPSALLPASGDRSVPVHRKGGNQWSPQDTSAHDAEHSTSTVTSEPQKTTKPHFILNFTLALVYMSSFVRDGTRGRPSCRCVLSCSMSPHISSLSSCSVLDPVRPVRCPACLSKVYRSRSSTCPKQHASKGHSGV